MITLTFKEIVDFASENDGECVVALYESGPEMFEGPHLLREGEICWDYLFLDEAENFDFDFYRIEGAPSPIDESP